MLGHSGLSSQWSDAQCDALDPRTGDKVSRTSTDVDELYKTHNGQANFIHVEPYDVPRVRRGECANLGDCVVLTTSEWGLESEPWVFIVDRGGIIAGKYEGLVSYEELEAALKPLLASQ